MKVSHSMFIIALALVVLLGAGGTQAQAQEKETFVGMLAQMSGPAAGATGTLQITVERALSRSSRISSRSARSCVDNAISPQSSSTRTGVLAMRLSSFR